MITDTYHLPLGLVLKIEQYPIALSWTIEDANGAMVGVGTFELIGDGWCAVIASIEPPYRRRGLYSGVLARLARRFGFISSSVAQSTQGAAVWRRAGAQYDGRRWMLLAPP